MEKASQIVPGRQLAFTSHLVTIRRVRCSDLLCEMFRFADFLELADFLPAGTSSNGVGGSLLRTSAYVSSLQVFLVCRENAHEDLAVVGDGISRLPGWRECDGR